MTKWRPNRSVTFNRWKACSRCGLDWPVKELKREPETGALVCIECLDEPCHADIKARGEVRTSGTRQSSPWDPE